MINAFKKFLLLHLIFFIILFGSIQKANAQNLMHDSLRHMLVYFEENTKDEKLKQAIKEVRDVDTGDVINNVLSRKLLDLDDLLAKSFVNNQSLLLNQVIAGLLEQLQPIGMHPDYAYSLDYLAGSYHRMSQYQKALPLYQKALDIKKKALGEEHPNCATSLINLAALYESMGKDEQIYPLCEQAYAIVNKVQGEEDLGYALNLNYLAAFYIDMGQYDKALPLIQQALTILKKVLGKNHPECAKSLKNLAFLYEDMGQYDKALPLLQEVLEINKKEYGEESLSYSYSLSDLAGVYHYMKQHDRALLLYDQALDYTRKAVGEEDPSYAVSLNNYALLLSQMEQYDKALYLYQQALAIVKKTYGIEHLNYAIGLNNLALLYRSMGKYNDALPLFQQSLFIIKKALGNEHPSYANSITNLGILQALSGNITEAASDFAQASEIKLKNLSRSYGVLSEWEKMVYLYKETYQFDYLPSLLFAQKTEWPSAAKQVYEIEFVLKGMVLQDQQKVLSAIRKTEDSTALRLYEQWRFNKVFLGKQLLLPVAQRVPYVDSLEEVTTQLEQQLSYRTNVFRNQIESQDITPKKIGQKLAKDEAAVEFIRFHLYNRNWTDSIMYAAIILLPRDSIPKFVPLFEEKQLQHLLERPAGSITAYQTIKKLYAANSKETDAGDSLYNLIWKPLERCLTGIHTVSYAPAGLLHRIAFQALRSDSAHFLIDKFQLNQMLSTRSIAFPTQVNKRPFMVSVWGDIDYRTDNSIASRLSTRGENEVINEETSSFNFYTWDTRGSRGGEWEPLPGTRQEMDSLKKVCSRAGIPITATSGTLATEEQFKALDGKSPQVLHLATHGFFLPGAEMGQKNNHELSGNNLFTVQQNPMFRSGLVMSGGNRTWKGEAPFPGKEDGILTAYEIAQMDLSNTDLVILSACGTALGDLQGTEGIVGLQRAFKLAGVKQMIVSLWPVPDVETAELVTMFYRNWLSGQDTWKALRKAQLSMKEKYPLPFYWAAFILIN